jgi:iron(III) transport system ATP-binding protein
MALSDRVVVMNAGRVQQVGEPFAIYARPDNRFVADFIGRVNFLEGRVLSSGEAGVTVEVRGRRLEVPLPGKPYRGGDAVTVVIRPETITLSPSPPPGQSGFLGTIRRALYQGATAEYEIDWDGTPLLAVSGNPLEQGLLPEGTRVGVEFAGRTAHLLAAAGPDLSPRR